MDPTPAIAHKLIGLAPLTPTVGSLPLIGRLLPEQASTEDSLRVPLFLVVVNPKTTTYRGRPGLLDIFIIAVLQHYGK